MVRVDGEGSAFHHMLEVTDGLMNSMELSVIRRPLLLALTQFLREEGKWFPTFGTTLFDDATDGDVRGVGCNCEREAGVRVMQHGCVGQSFLYCFE